METVSLSLKIPAPGENKIFLYDELTSESAKEFNEKLHKLCLELDGIEKKNNGILTRFINKESIIQKQSIELHLNTPGGYCYDGFSIYDTLNQIVQNRPIDIYAEGIVASMGIAILCSVPIERRLSRKNTVFMIHSVSSGNFGKINDLKESVQHTETLQKLLWDIVSNNTEIPIDRLRECEEKREDWYLTATEALEYGLISKII